MRRGWTVAVLLLFLFLMGHAPWADASGAPPRYKIVSLDSRLALDGSHVVNRFGVVVGSIAGSGSSANVSGSYLWRRGALKDLKISEADLPSSSLLAINDRGQIVGTLDKGSGEMNMHSFGHAFLWERGKWQDLSQFVPDEVSHARAINDKGEVAISAEVSSIYRPDDPEAEQQVPCYLYRKGRGVVLMGYGTVIVLNDNSQALLDLWATSQRPKRYAVWQDGRTTDLALPNDGSFTASDMNDRLQIIGNGKKGAALYEGGHFTFISPSLSCEANSINNSGQIVGYYYLPRAKSGVPVTSRAFLWQKGKLYDLDRLLPPKSGWVLEEAASINDRGQIVGRGIHRGKPSGFLMTPAG